MPARVFVAGASGAIGRPLVAHLVGAGHDVTGMTRSRPAATAAAVERGAPGVYDVVDDEPAPMREWIPVYADAIGARPPLRVPVWLARLAAGKAAASMSTTLPGASNARAKAELGWAPRWPSWRDGFRAAPR